MRNDKCAVLTRRQRVTDRLKCKLLGFKIFIQINILSCSAALDACDLHCRSSRLARNPIRASTRTRSRNDLYIADTLSTTKMAQRVRDISNSSARHGQLALAKNTRSLATGSEH
jgi:hypothetical protein